MAPRIVAVTGARDGVGRSTFAVNLTLSLLKETRSRVLLLDLDGESCGDCQALMGMPVSGEQAARSVLDFAPYTQQLTPDQFRQYISAHPAGVGVIPLAPSPERSGEVTLPKLQELLGLAAPLCDYLVVDCGAGLNDRSVKIFEQAAGIFVLTTPELAALRHTRRMVDALQRLQFPKELVKVIANRVPPKGGLTPDQMTRVLGRKFMVTLPNEADTAFKAELEASPFVLGQPRARLSRVYDEFVRKLVEMGALERMLQMARPQGLSGVGGGRGAGLSADAQQELAAYQKRRGGKAANMEQVDARTALKMLLHKRMVEAVDLKGLERELEAQGGDRDEALRERITQAVVKLMDQVGGHISDRADRKRIVKEVVDEAVGLGPLEDLLDDDAVTEIMVNGKDTVFIERNGKITKSTATFTDDAQLIGVIERIVAPLGRRIDEKSPMVDARLKDGSRVNAIIPPLAIDGPSITIRKFSKDPFKVKDLVRFGSMTAEMADFLRACVEAHLNVLISGGTGSGKTTLLNVLSSFIPSDERIVTVEDSAELQLKQPHIVRLETRPPNVEGEGEVSIRDLVKNTLRMRPDRIVVGECRGAEAIDMLQAMNTGHDGSLTTIHSNSPRDCLSRLETLVMFAGLDLPSRAIREQMASAIHIIVQQSRLSDGSRKITQISEVTGMEGNVITLQDIFVFKQEGYENGKVLGRYMATGFVPRFVQTLQARGIAMPKGLFARGSSSPAESSVSRPPAGRPPRGRRR